MSKPQEEHLSVLKRYFGHSEFRPKQWDIIKSVFEKRDTCVVMATGYGKSLCYQFPPVFQDKLGIVVSPLISLMEDQVLSLQMCNIPACQLGSSQKDKKGTHNRILNNEYRLIYVTPEWCSSEICPVFFNQLHENNVKISLVAIDEAHCISQWGFDFRSSYRHLGKLREMLPSVPFMAMTATATPQVRKDICFSLKLKNPEIVCTSFDRPNLYLSASLKGKDITSDIKPLLDRTKLVSGSTSGSVIIYCSTKKIADKVADHLNGDKIKCALYHADLSLKIRQQVHQDFVKDKIQVIVATIAFGMGIDKPDVRVVIHYGAPKDLESFYQEIGRAGRDGLQSYCHVLYSQADFKLNEFFFKNLSGKFLEHKQKLASTLQYYLQTRDCRRKILLSHFDPSGKFTELKKCCDNCDKKHLAVPTLDLTDDCLLLLEAVKEFQGGYGLSMSIFLLRGSTNKRLPNEYYSHKLYGAGCQKNDAWWKSLGNLLLREGFLKNAVPSFAKGKHSFITFVSITGKGEKYLNNKGGVIIEPTPEMLSMAKHVLPRNNSWVDMSSTSTSDVNETRDIRSESGKLQTVSPSVDPYEKKLQESVYDALFNLRTKLAQNHECMPYMVASIKTLQELSIKRPESLEGLSGVEGMTEAKVNNFGESIIDCIMEKTGKRKEKKTPVMEERRTVVSKSEFVNTDDWCSVEKTKEEHVFGSNKSCVVTEPSQMLLNVDCDIEIPESESSNGGMKIVKEDNSPSFVLNPADNPCIDSSEDGWFTSENLDSLETKNVPQCLSEKKSSSPTSKFQLHDEQNQLSSNNKMATVSKACTKRGIEFDSDSDDENSHGEKRLKKESVLKKNPKKVTKRFLL